MDLLKAQAKYNLHKLRQALERHADLSSMHRYSHDKFSNEDMDTVMEAVFAASKKDYRLIIGAADFLTLLLSVEDHDEEEESEYEYGHEDDLCEVREMNDDISDCASSSEDEEFHVVMTRDTLVASAFHYCDCVIARDSGIYDVFDNMMRATTRHDYATGRKTFKLQQKSDIMNREDGGDGKLLGSTSSIEVWDRDAVDVHAEPDVTMDNIDGFLEVASKFRVEDITEGLLDAYNSVERFGQEATNISRSAAKVKKAEIMTHSILPKSIEKVTPSPIDAASKRGLLLSTSEDWRALAIRSSASLYRLKGLLRQQLPFDINTSENLLPGYSNQNVVREAREALYIYAPLAERLGMHRLKSELENTAFRVLYRRQYNTALALYAKSGAAIESVTDFITKAIDDLLKNDPWLAPQLERLTVASRVKKPYSLWKKILKARLSGSTTPSSDINSRALSHGMHENLSITSVLDAVAIRVIIKSKKMRGDESKRELESREEFLCYYIQNRLLRLWPEMSSDRIKDYISTPKPNGYQSLHHTSQCFRYGCYWPFEVQIRSEDMHNKSEYGVAAHWDYKLKGDKLIDQKTVSSRKLLKGSHHDGVMAKPPHLFDDSDYESAGSSMNATLANIKIGRLRKSFALKSSVNALSTARKHLVEKNVFVFFLTSSDKEEGKVIGLPIGSTVVDALINICQRCNLNVPESFEASDFDVFVNGNKSELYEPLSNGDTIMFPSLGRRIGRYL